MAVKRRVVIVTHARLRESGTIVCQTVDQLRRVGFEVDIVDSLPSTQFAQHGSVVDDNTEIVLVLGGDGTILQAAELVHCTQVPICGINLGHVGFLAEFESFQMKQAIERIAQRDYVIDERMIAHVDVLTADGAVAESDWALNDVTVERAHRGRMLELSIGVNGVEMSSFGCDGVIVTTPTGSTAYAYSAGGAIMWPTVQALQMVPLAAHALFSRPLVIGSDSTFSMTIVDDSSSEGWICCDGRRERSVSRGTQIHVRQSSDTLRLARLSGASFTERLVSKFELPVVGWRGKMRGNTAKSASHDSPKQPASQRTPIVSPHDAVGGEYA